MWWADFWATCTCSKRFKLSEAAGLGNGGMSVVAWRRRRSAGGGKLWHSFGRASINPENWKLSGNVSSLEKSRKSWGISSRVSIGQGNRAFLSLDGCKRLTSLLAPICFLSKKYQTDKVMGSSVGPWTYECFSYIAIAPHTCPAVLGVGQKVLIK